MHKCKALFAIITLIIAIIWVWMGDSFPIHPFCPFHKITGIPCPGCGGTRAARLLLAGDLKAAILMNPLSVLLCILIPILTIIFCYDTLKGSKHLEYILKKKWNKTTFIIVVSIIIINWLWNIYKEFNIVV